MSKCLCGCGGDILSGRSRYLYGHRPVWDQKCACGCGKTTKQGHKFLKGHFTKEAREAINKKIKETRLANPPTEEERKRHSEMNKGEKNPMWGKTRSEETRRKSGESIKKRYEEDPTYNERRKASIKEAFSSPEARQRLSESKKGRKFSEETRKKISETNRKTWSDPVKLKEHSDLMKEVMHRPEVLEKLRAVHSTEDWKQRMRIQTLTTWQDPKVRAQRLAAIRAICTNPEWQAKIRRRKGREHPNWNGGTSNEDRGPNYTLRLRRVVRKRDNFTCIICSTTEQELGGKLTVHHVDYIRQHSFPENLVSICRSCHGKTNKDREYWREVFTQYLLSYYPQTSIEVVSLA